MFKYILNISKGYITKLKVVSSVTSRIICNISRIYYRHRNMKMHMKNLA